MKSLSILQILAASKSPNFGILKQAYIYGIILKIFEEYMSESLALASKLPFRINLNSVEKVLVIHIKSEIGYLVNHLKMSQSNLEDYFYKELKNKKIITSRGQFRIQIGN